MKLTVISLFIPFRSKRKISLPETYRIVKNAGFEYIDVDSIMAGTMAPAEFHAEVKKGLQETGLKVSSYIAFLPFPVYDEARHQDVLQMFREEIDFCQEIGSPLLMAAPCAYQEDVAQYGREIMAQRLSETLQEATAYAAAKGVRIGIEDAPDLQLPMCSEAEVGRLLKENPSLGLFFDTGNMYPMQENPLQYYTDFKNRIFHVHVKDLLYTTPEDEYQGDLLTNGRRVDGATVGEGIVPLKTLLPQMKQDGYEGFLSLEYTPTDNSFSDEAYTEELKKNLENLKQLIKGESIL